MKSGIVALAGRPNVGKSTLLNKILGESISIVTPKAQTTREQLRGIFTEPRGQIVFIDTPGLHNAKPGGMNAFMVKDAEIALESPDVVLYLIDPLSDLAHETAIAEKLIHAGGTLIPVINKTDLKISIERIENWTKPWIKEFSTKRKASTLAPMQISAYKGIGISELLQQIFDLLPEGAPLYGDDTQLTDKPVRYIVSELIRKQLFLKLGDEIPYCTAVEIQNYDENKKPLHIHASILVERDSQKGMVIGAGGKKIKEIGMTAREEIEKFLGEKIFLGLQVKVQKDWSSDTNTLKRLGMQL